MIFPVISHPCLHVCTDVAGALFIAPIGPLKEVFNQAKAEAIQVKNDRRDAIHTRYESAVEPILSFLREQFNTGLEAGTIFERAAWPAAWIVATDPESYHRMIAQCLYVIDDEESYPLPITTGNCSLHGIQNSKDEIKKANDCKGKGARGIIPGIWGRKKASIYDPLTHLLRLDFDTSTITERDAALQRLTDLDLTWSCYPSYSARDEVAKAHLYIWSSIVEKAKTIARNYNQTIINIFGTELCKLCDEQQSPATQLSFLTCIRRRLHHPLFMPRHHLGSKAWTDYLPTEDHQESSYRSPKKSASSAIINPMKKELSSEMIMVRASFPLPVPTAIIAGLRRRHVALCSCIQLSVSGWNSDAKRMFLKQLSENIRAFKPDSRYTYDCLIGMLCEKDPLFALRAGQTAS